MVGNHVLGTRENSIKAVSFCTSFIRTKEQFLTMTPWALSKTSRKTTVSCFQGWARSSAFNGKCAECTCDQMGWSTAICPLSSAGKI